MEKRFNNGELGHCNELTLVNDVAIAKSLKFNEITTSDLRPPRNGRYNDVTSLPSYLPTLRASKRAAFTLAEVLITLGIIGVVAAITLPPLITNIQSQVKTKRVQNIKQKFSKATDKMLAMSGMNGYGSTENFVEELKHHLKIAKVCDNNHLAECWGYEKVKLKDGKEWEISKTKTGKTLKMTDSETEEWANTVGIVTADGTSMILSYNKKCDMTTNINPKWDANQSSSTNCIAAVFDYNGGTKPNKFIGDVASKDFAKADVIAFNAGGLGTECILELNGRCFTKVIKPSDITEADALRYGYTWCAGENAGTITGSGENAAGTDASATGEAATLGITKCSRVYDFWNATVAMCGGTDKLIKMKDIDDLKGYMYSVNPVPYSPSTDSNLYSSQGESLLMALGLSVNDSFTLWSSSEIDARNIYAREFHNNYSYSSIYYRAHADFFALCTE